jgi:transposase-like protein
MRIRKKHNPTFKFKVALEALAGEPIVDICQRYSIAASLVHKWRDQLKKHGAQVFGELSSRGEADWQRERDKLYAHIGELSTQVSFLKKVLGD